MGVQTMRGGLFRGEGSRRYSGFDQVSSTKGLIFSTLRIINVDKSLNQISNRVVKVSAELSHIATDGFSDLVLRPVAGSWLILLDLPTV